MRRLKKLVDLEYGFMSKICDNCATVFRQHTRTRFVHRGDERIDSVLILMDTDLPPCQNTCHQTGDRNHR